MNHKSPRQSMSKKSQASIKEKRAQKRDEAADAGSMPSPTGKKH